MIGHSTTFGAQMRDVAAPFGERAQRRGDATRLAVELCVGEPHVGAIAMADADDRQSIGVLLGAQRQQFTHGQIDEARAFLGAASAPVQAPIRVQGLPSWCLLAGSSAAEFSPDD